MMIGRMTSLPLPVELPSAEGAGVGGNEAMALGGTETEAVGTADAAAVTAGVGDGAATATVKVHVPRATSLSSTEFVVHSTWYEPDSSGEVGVATIRWSSAGSAPPSATVPPPTSLTTSVLPSTLMR